MEARPTGSPRSAATHIGPLVCVASGVLALGMFVWLVTTMPHGLEAQALVDHPWSMRWMRVVLVTAASLPVSTVLLWRACPVTPLPRHTWPRGDKTPLRQRVRRGAPPRAKLALIGMTIHALCLIALPVVALIAAGEL